MNITKLTDDYAVAPQIRLEEIATLAADGFVAIICNRPDDEEPGQPSAAEIAGACELAGLAFHHIPVTMMPIPATDVQEHRRIVDESDGPVLAYCRSGQRSVAIWQASA